MRVIGFPALGTWIEECWKLGDMHRVICWSLTAMCRLLKWIVWSILHHKLTFSMSAGKWIDEYIFIFQCQPMCLSMFLYSKRASANCFGFLWFQPAPSTFDEVFQCMFDYIDRLFVMVRPRKLLYMAIGECSPNSLALGNWEKSAPPSV